MMMILMIITTITLIVSRYSTTLNINFRELSPNCYRSNYVSYATEK
jgi:hypothetical protein